MNAAIKFVVAAMTVVAIAVVFGLGFFFSVYLSLRSSEVKVPDVVGKDRYVAENELTSAGLNFRVRATRPSNQLKADSVLFQLPRAGELVKTGQTVAVDLSRAAKEGEASETVPDSNSNKENNNSNTNDSTAANTNTNNDNKPKRPRNANSNNANGNANGNANVVNRNANANRPRPNVNASNGNDNSEGNANRRANTNRTPDAGGANANRTNRNVNRPTPVPTPPR